MRFVVPSFLVTFLTCKRQFRGLLQFQNVLENSIPRMEDAQPSKRAKEIPHPLFGDMSNELVTIDGSYGEGGGQIVRNAVALACLLRRKIKVVDIRRTRPKPGLSSQHLQSIRALMEITGATTAKKLKLGDVEFEFDGRYVPCESSGITKTIDLVTAGSVSLCIQCLLPYLLNLKTTSQVKIIGGTHVLYAPSFEYLYYVFCPTLRQFMDMDVKVELEKPGYFPRGGGIVNLTVGPHDFATKQVLRRERGPLIRILCFLDLTPDLMSLKEKYIGRIIKDTKEVTVRQSTYVAMEYICEYENSYAGFQSMSNVRQPKDSTVMDCIDQVHDRYDSFAESTACVDGYMQDQLILYMVLAKYGKMTGENHIRTTSPIGDHALSAMYVAETMTPHKFTHYQEVQRDYQHSICL